MLIDSAMPIRSPLQCREAGAGPHAHERTHLIQGLGFAIDHKLVGVALVAYNFGQDPAFHQSLLGSLEMIAVRCTDRARGARAQGRTLKASFTGVLPIISTRRASGY
jgi:hypothetical protein